MISLVLLLVMLYASRTEAQDFLCGFSLVRESEDIQEAAPKVTQETDQLDGHYQSGTIHPVIVFGKFKNQDDPANLDALLDRDGLATQSAESLLGLNHEGSLAHYFYEMSNRALTLAPPPGGIDTNWYESDWTDVEDYVGQECLVNAYYGNTNSGYRGMPGFVEDVLKAADGQIDFHQRDATGDWIYDKNEDNVVDVVTLFFPPEFLKVCNGGKTADGDNRAGGLGNAFIGSEIEYETKDAGPDGTPLTVKRVIVSTVAFAYKNDSGTIDWGPLPPSFSLMVGIVAHEYGHVMGLPDLYATGWTGIGAWGLMGRGAIGWLHNYSNEPNPVLSAWDGPNPLSAWSQMFVGWITPDTVDEDMLEVQVHDVTSSARNAYKIPISESEYFLVSNRKNTGSYYDDYAPASGLAIWHVDGNLYHGQNYPLPNSNFRHKFVDLECADGLYSDTGDADSVTGGDDIDYNQVGGGDATDLWDGVDYTAFTPSTNPSTMGYAVVFPDPNDPEKELTEQRVRTGIAVHNIQALDGGVMQADIYRNYWSGPITEDTVWNIWDGRIITVGGDVTIRSGVTLTIMPGVEVRFIANSDDTGSGNDNVLSELIVEDGGRLIAGEQLEGSILLPVIFRSSTNDPMQREWYGFHVESGGHATFTNVTIRDAVHCIPTPANSANSLPDNLTFDNVTLIKCGTPPTIAGNPTPEFPEDRTEPVADYTADDAEGDAVAWSLGTDADEGAFTLTSAGELDFKEPPDFETLNGDSLFYVTVRATDRQQAFQQAFTAYPATSRRWQTPAGYCGRGLHV